MGISIDTEQHSGPAPAVVMIHGWNCRKEDWRAQIEHLKDRHELLAIDLPGHGGSPAGDREDWSIPAFAEDVMDILKAVSSDAVILMGHSMGGTVALEVAARIPERVRGVILVDTFLIDYGELKPETIDGFYRPFSENFKGAVSDLIENTTGPQASDDLKQRLKEEMSGADPAWALKVWWELLNWDPEPAFKALQAPVHAINCPLIPDRTRHRLAPYMDETVVPETGHFLHQEAPDAFNRTLDAVIPAIADRK